MDAQFTVGGAGAITAIGVDLWAAYEEGDRALNQQVDDEQRELEGGGR